MEKSPAAVAEKCSVIRAFFPTTTLSPFEIGTEFLKCDIKSEEKPIETVNFR